MNVISQNEIDVEIDKIFQAIETGKNYLSRKYPNYENECAKICEFIQSEIENNFPHLKGKIIFNFNKDSESNQLLWSIGGALLGSITGSIFFGKEGAIGGGIIGAGVGYLSSKIEIRIIRENDHFQLSVVPS